MLIAEMCDAEMCDAEMFVHSQFCLCFRGSSQLAGLGLMFHGLPGSSSGQVEQRGCAATVGYEPWAAPGCPVQGWQVNIICGCN